MRVVKVLVVRVLVGAAAGCEIFTCTCERLETPVLVETKISAKKSTAGLASNELAMNIGFPSLLKARIFVELAFREMFALELSPVETIRFAPEPVCISEKTLWVAKVASVSNMLALAVFKAIGSIPTIATTAKDTIPSAITTSTRENAGFGFRPERDFFDRKTGFLGEKTRLRKSEGL